MKRTSSPSNLHHFDTSTSNPAGLFPDLSYPETPPLLFILLISTRRIAYPLCRSFNLLSQCVSMLQRFPVLSDIWFESLFFFSISYHFRSFPSDFIPEINRVVQCNSDNFKVCFDPNPTLTDGISDLFDNLHFKKVIQKGTNILPLGLHYRSESKRRI